MADIGYEPAQTNFAYLLDRGECKEMFKEYSSQAKLSVALNNWQRSANQDYSMARIKLGDYHYYGYGTDVDLKAVFAPFWLLYKTFQASQQYKIAVERHVASQAMFNLGYMHENGEGLSKVNLCIFLFIIFPFRTFILLKGTTTWLLNTMAMLRFLAHWLCWSFKLSFWWIVSIRYDSVVFFCRRLTAAPGSLLGPNLWRVMGHNADQYNCDHSGILIYENYAKTTGRTTSKRFLVDLLSPFYPFRVLCCFSLSCAQSSLSEPVRVIY